MVLMASTREDTSLDESNVSKAAKELGSCIREDANVNKVVSGGEAPLFVYYREETVRRRAFMEGQQHN